MIGTHRPRFTTLQGFLNWKPEDRYKYEWNAGKVEKTLNMKQLEFFILQILQRLFIKTTAFEQGGELITEGDVMTSNNQLRRPDLAYYTKEQIIEAAKGKNQVPQFVIEIISPNDSQEQILLKNKEYFSVGVQLIWLVLPKTKQVHIYRSPKQVTICTDHDICSALPVLERFELKTQHLFELGT